MAGGRMKYEGKPLTVSTDAPVEIELPSLVYCGRLTGMLFDTDKTFLLPGAIAGMRQLKEYYDEHPPKAVLIVGHTDARGAAAHNVTLSEERARSVRAFLTDDVDAWVACYRGVPVGRPWGRLEDQHMLAALGSYAGVVNGGGGKAWRDAWKTYRDAHGGGDAPARRALVEAYLKQDGTSLPAGTSIELHGCGAFHREAEGDDQDSHRRNRRVEIFLYQGPIDPPPSRCAAPGCTAYPEWRKRSIAQEDFRDAGEDEILWALELPVDLVDRLPAGLRLRLTGDGIPDMERALADARRDGGTARLEFGWVQERCATRLEALGGKRSLTLWRDRVVGDTDVDSGFEAMLDELIEEDAAAEGEPVWVAGAEDEEPAWPTPSGT